MIILMSGHRFDAIIMYCLAIDPLKKMIVVLMTDTLVTKYGHYDDGG